MCSGGGTRALPRVGFPIRKSPDQRLISSSPRLIAAVHVLHRLQVPRHPPCALIHLIFVENTTKPLWSFQGARRGSRPATRGTREAPAKGPPVSQNSTVWAAGRERPAKRGCRRCSRRARATDGTSVPSTCRAPAAVGAAAFPRKEVIQPQLPLRLPCYDFTPITDSTFGRCLPYGLAHGLRVFPAFVV
jgi:hypothetical protein